MKFLSVSLVLAGLIHPAAGEEKLGMTPVVETKLKWEVEIPGTISDGKPGTPPTPPVLPHFSVKLTRTFQKDVVEGPPMPGLPNVEGRISVTIRKVIDPGLPELSKPLPPRSPDDPAVLARLDDYRENYQGTQLVLVSATVYDHSRTFLRIYPNGRAEDAVTCWSNLDFNLFSGWGSFRATGPDGEIREYHLLMGIGNEDSERSAKLAGGEYEAPQIPRMRDASQGPDYVIVEGKDSGSRALETLGLLHKLYSKEGSRMEQAYLSRVAEQRKRRAYFLAHPPKPKDVVMNYWRGKRPENTAGRARQ